MMGLYGGGMGPVGWFAFGAFWLLLLGLTVWLVAMLLPGSIAGGTSRSSDEPGLEVLDRRLADGEIDLGTWREPVKLSV